MRRITLLVLITFFLSTSLPTNSLAFSCDNSPDPWFSYRIDFDESTLPAGVEFITKNEYVERTEYGKFSLKNNGSTPLYLVEVQDTSKPIYNYPNSELPNRVIPGYKLFDGKAFYYTTYPFMYTNAGGINNSGAYELNIDKYKLDRMGVKVVDVYKDDRPSSAEPPSAQEFSITAYYDGKPIQIGETIDYAINKNYDPKAGVKKTEDCEKFGRIQTVYTIVPFLIAFTLLGLTILGLTLGYRLIKKRG